MSERGPLLPFLLSLDPNFSSVACPVFGMSMMSKLLAWVLCRTVMWSFAGWNPSFRGAALRRGSPRCLCSSRRRCLRPSGRNSRHYEVKGNVGTRAASISRGLPVPNTLPVARERVLTGRAKT